MALSLGLVSPVRPAWARVEAPATTGARSASVLELDGPDPELSARLGDVLREELSARGVGGGRAATTAEVRIALECESLDDPCLTRAARLLGARLVIFGALKAEPRTLELRVFAADAARIEQSIELPLSEDDLHPSRLQITATRAADLLFPDTAATQRPGPPPASDTPADAAEPASGGDDPRGKLEWGPYSPRPRWKWATFGTSAALLGAGLVGFMVTVIPVAQSNTRRGFLHRNIESAARESLGNSSTIDDVDPGTVLDMCSDEEGSGGALEVLDADDGVATSGVRNVEVGRECRKADAWGRWATRSIIFTSVMAVSTAAFTALLFVRRVPRAERRLSLGIAPDLEGGAHLVGGLRF